MSANDITYNIDQGIATLTFNRPQARNALTFEMYNQLAELSHKEPLKCAYELANTMQGHAPLTIAATKEGLRRLRENSAAIENEDLIVQCYTSNDFKEGLEAFLEKRTPQWTGE